MGGGNTPSVEGAAVADNSAVSVGGGNTPSVEGAAAADNPAVSVELLRTIMTRSRTKNQRSRKRKRNRRRQQKKKRPLIPIPADQPGLYAVRDGGMHLPDMNSQTPQLPLSRRESELLLRIKLASDSIGPRCIYQVRAYRHDETTKWLYEGRGYNSITAYPLRARWLTINNMPDWWRKRTVWKQPKYWFKCRILSTEDMRAGCIPSAIIKFYDHVGMSSHGTLLSLRWQNGLTSWGGCIDFIQTAKGFALEKPPNCVDLTENLLVLGKKKCLFLMQISAFSLSKREFDNLHAICVFNGLIFDGNHKDPLPLTRTNLDECCLGGTDWVFHHVSRVRQFVPTSSTATNIEHSTSKRLRL